MIHIYIHTGYVYGLFNVTDNRFRKESKSKSKSIWQFLYMMQIQFEFVRASFGLVCRRWVFDYLSIIYIMNFICHHSLSSHLELKAQFNIQYEYRYITENTKFLEFRSIFLLIGFHIRESVRVQVVNSL